MENKAPYQSSDALDQLLASGKLSELKSHSPLAEIKKNLFFNLGFGIIITLAFVAAIVLIEPLIVRILFSLIVFYCVWSIRKTYQVYCSVAQTISPTLGLLQELELNKHTLQTWIQEQEKMGLFFYPISIIAGFLLGGTVGSGKSESEFMNNWKAAITLIAALGILIPICFYLTRWMFRYSFGKHLQKLQDNIEALKKEE
jgi:hypothetical protein